MSGGSRVAPWLTAAQFASGFEVPELPACAPPVPKLPAKPSGPWLPPPPLYALDSVGPGVKAQPASMSPKPKNERKAIDRITAPFRNDERQGN